MAAVIELNDVRVRRGTTVILDKVNWSITEGEHWVILGPTLVSLLSGGIEADA